MEKLLNDEKIGVSRKDRRFEHKRQRNMNRKFFRGDSPEDYLDEEELEEMFDPYE
jgi:hypothetical protein